MKRTVLIAIGLAGCGTVRQTDRVAAPRPLERQWVLQTLQGDRVQRRPEKVATLKFHPDRTVGGTIACNSTSSAKLRWLEAPGKMRGTFDMYGRGAGITTTVGCNDKEAEAIAGRFWNLMETARTWSVERHVLIIAFTDGSEARLIPLRR